MLEFPFLPLALALWLFSLSAEEWWAYGAAFVVLVGVVGESIASLTEWIKSDRNKKRLEKASALVLILGLAGDLIAIRMSQVELARVIEDVGNTRLSADKAADDANRANDSAREANQEAGNARLTAGMAKSVAAKAELVAQSARQEADSFEKDIVSAKEQATLAEAHLAEALRRAAEASEALNRFKSPRTLTREQQQRLIEKLNPFAKTPFELSVSPDPESIGLLGLLEEVLVLSNWDERNPEGTVSVKTPKGMKAELELASGIVIMVPEDKILEFEPAAKALGSALLEIGLSVKGGKLKVGKHKVIRIAIGKKP